GEPTGRLVRDQAGNLYGATTAGGSSNYGVVFKIDATGQETVLHSFTGGADGGTPIDGVALDSPGNLYGAAFVGGSGRYPACFNGPCGVIFKLDTHGRETVLHNFNGSDGESPVSVILDARRNLYGITKYGGHGYGVVFKLDSVGNYGTLYAF